MLGSVLLEKSYWHYDTWVFFTYKSKIPMHNSNHISMKKAFYGLICHKKLQNVAHNYPKMQQIALQYSAHWCVLAKSRTVKNFIFLYALFYDLVKFIMSWKTAKGQLILKGHFGVLKSTKKNQRNFCKNFKNQKSKDTTLLC